MLALNKICHFVCFSISDVFTVCHKSTDVLTVYKYVHGLRQRGSRFYQWTDGRRRESQLFRQRLRAWDAIPGTVIFASGEINCCSLIAVEKCVQQMSNRALTLTHKMHCVCMSAWLSITRQIFLCLQRQSDGDRDFAHAHLIA